MHKRPHTFWDPQSVFSMGKLGTPRSPAPRDKKKHMCRREKRKRMAGFAPEAIKRPAIQLHALDKLLSRKNHRGRKQVIWPRKEAELLPTNLEDSQTDWHII
ncbi:UNVERIFIED_CONTAM: hypothetical protein K2H54_030926 [Gekko kuhli]